MRRKHAHLKMPIKKSKVTTEDYSIKPCKRCLKEFQPTTWTRYCDKCLEEIEDGYTRTSR